MSECIGYMSYKNGMIIIDGDIGTKRYIFHTPIEAEQLYIDDYKKETFFCNKDSFDEEYYISKPDECNSLFI